MRILLIDESPGDARLVGVALTDCGSPVTVTHAPDGETGLALLRHESYQLVLLGLDLPGITGWDVLAALRGWEDLPPVVVLTNSRQNCPTSGVKALGAVACLVKPLYFQEFSELIRRVANRWLVSCLAAGA